jgi:protein phosphatase
MGEMLVIKPGALVLLVGAPASGKSTWARNNFKENEIVSSDRIRGWLSGDENNQECSSQAFTILHMIVQQRLRFNQTVVVDATNTKPSDRTPYIAAARNYKRKVVGVIFNTSLKECVMRDALRERKVGSEVIEKFHSRMHQAVIDLKEEVDEFVIVTPGCGPAVWTKTLEEIDADFKEDLARRRKEMGVEKGE